jgi:hypothetical protein
LSIKDPSGKIIINWYPKGRYDNGFTAQDTGVYTVIFKNLDNVNDESIYVGFLSSYDLRIAVYDGVGWLMMLGSAVILFFSILWLRNA